MQIASPFLCSNISHTFVAQTIRMRQFLLFVGIAVFIGCSKSKDEIPGTKDPILNAPLVGQWIQIYPEKTDYVYYLEFTEDFFVFWSEEKLPYGDLKVTPPNGYYTLDKEFVYYLVTPIDEHGNVHEILLPMRYEFNDDILTIEDNPHGLIKYKRL